LLLTLRTTGGTGSKSLLLKVEPHRPGAQFPAALGRERTLLEGYRDIRFEYLRGAADLASRPPRLVSILLESADGTSRRISATPRVDSDGRCRFDPISMTCR
jgi:hypothetical protein